MSQNNLYYSLIFAVYCFGNIIQLSFNFLFNIPLIINIMIVLVKTPYSFLFVPIYNSFITNNCNQ